MPGSLLLSRLGVLLFVPCFPVLVSCVQTPPGARVAVPPSPHWCMWRSPCLRAQVPWDVYWTLPFCGSVGTELPPGMGRLCGRSLW